MGTKERLSLEEAGAETLIACEHRHRYRFAAAALRGLRVLDLCCGSGYGSLIIAETAASVHGVDIDPVTIDRAAAASPADLAVSFEAGDALEYLRRADIADRFDAIVCFEGLEHLRRLDATLERLRELAEGGMRMVLSVPNSRGLGEENEYHVSDFSLEEARERIGSFPDAELMTQYLAEGSILCRADQPAWKVDGRVVLGDRHEPEYANHYVVCVGVVPPSAEAAMQAEAAPAFNRYMRNLERANDELLKANRRLARAHLGKLDSSAGALVAKYQDARDRAEALDEEHAALQREHQAWIERCLGAEAREEELKARLAAFEQRMASLPVRILVKAFTRRG